MLKNEFDKLIGRPSVNIEYLRANAVYNVVSMDKQLFCEEYKKWGKTRLFQEIVDAIGRFSEREIASTRCYNNLKYTHDRRLDLHKEALAKSDAWIVFFDDFYVKIRADGSWFRFFKDGSKDDDFGEFKTSPDDFTIVTSVMNMFDRKVPPEVFIAFRVLGMECKFNM